MNKKLSSHLLLSSLLTLSAAFSWSPEAFSAPRCESVLSGDRTLIEGTFSTKMPALNAQDYLNLQLARMRATNDPLVERILAAKREKERGKSLRVDLSSLATHMVFFVEGPFEKVVGARGVSKPFMDIKKIDDNTLVLHHEGDTFPLMIKWNSQITEISAVRSQKVGDTLYQVLELPDSMKSKERLNEVKSKYIYALIAGSALNKYIPSSSSPIISIAAALHDGRLVFDRPTQQEAKAVRKIIRENPELRAKVKSLLFVAPTASGKTRVLGDAIIDTIQAHSPRKLIVLATKTPDLISELAQSIGGQLHAEMGPANYRLIQWGGELSENMNLSQLLRFVDDSSLPVVLLTSYPTLAARAPEAAQKKSLFDKASALYIDEAHNATGETFRSVMQSALQQSAQIDIFGVTASPVTRSQRTMEIFDSVFWAAIDLPTKWAQSHLARTSDMKDSDNAIEWLRMAEQYSRAWERGEINASEPIFYHPEERGFKFNTIFKRGDSGTQYSVDIRRLVEIWPDIAPLIEGHGPGVLHTYPRDAEPIAQALSELTGKNFVSLQKLSVGDRTEIYTAFRKKTPFKGRVVDAIVGTIREGLDFPEAGWYLSFKKYVQFPENIQGPGRVVRLAHNKLNPVIMFFGEELDRTSYQKVKELVMSRLGSLPRQLPEGRLYTGMRRGTQRDNMVKAIDRVNVSMEAFLRIHSDLTKQLGPKENLNPEAIKALQEILIDLRFASHNYEIDTAINNFVFELYSYPFFTGQLHSTWKFCDKMIALEKLSPEALSKKRISDKEALILKDAAMMSLIKEFRGFYSNIGPIPRAILAEFELKLLNVTEVAQATNVFVDIHNQTPTSSQFSDMTLATLVRQSMSVSPDGFWRRLSQKSRNLLKAEYDTRRLLTFEEALNDFYSSTQTLPVFTFSEVISHDRDVMTNLRMKLAKELAERIRSGQIEVRELSPEVQKALEQSVLLTGIVVKLEENLSRLYETREGLSTYITRLKAEGLFNYENLMLTEELGALRVVYDLSQNKDASQAKASYQRLKLRINNPQ
ncbi:MAG: DEAD/DEAH box helicase family protein [Bdellovibrio sp.]